MHSPSVIRLLCRPTLLLLVAFTLAMPAAAQPAGPPDEALHAPLVVLLDPVDGSGAQGTATIEVRAGDAQRTLVVLDLEGLEPGQAYVAHVHAGTRAAPSASFGLLGRLEADATGRAHLEADTLTPSASGQATELSLDLLADGDHLIDVHPLAGGPVAIGEIPRAAAGAALETEAIQALDPTDGSAARGTVTAALPAGRGRPGAATLWIEAEGLQLAARYTAHLHTGTPRRPAASTGLLGSAESDAAGQLHLQTTDVASASGAVVALTSDLLFDGAHFVDLHAPDGDLVATASLPRMEPTGIAAVDASLAAVQRGDVDGLVGLTRLSELPCGPQTPEGFALVPECLDGEPTGSLVPVLPAAACESYWARDPRPVLASFVEHAGAPYAVVRGPEMPAVDALWPAAEYLVVFTPRQGSFVAGLALYVAGDRVVAVQAGCTAPEQLVRDDDRPLPMIWRPDPIHEPGHATARPGG